MNQSRNVNQLGGYSILFLIKRKSSKSIGEIQKILQKKQIESRRIWKPIHQTQPYRNTIIIGGENSNYLFENTLSLPSSVGLTTTQQKKL